jgi:tRNA A-37 threonylcarbamoyl transferase component Bud32
MHLRTSRQDSLARHPALNGFVIRQGTQHLPACSGRSKIQVHSWIPDHKRVAAVSLCCSGFRGVPPTSSPMLEYPSPPASNSVAGSLTGKTVGRFVVGERLGKGGMGEVYRAEDSRLKRAVALKRLSPSLRSDPLYNRRFQEEAERASRFSDAHVAAVYDVLEDRDDVFLVMEFVEGRTLRQRLREPMSLEDFLGIAVQCAEALVAAHDRGILHCDIKPENIMLTPSGQVKILDFGVAKYLPRSDQSSTVDRSGTVGGTPAYMSPEVLLEKTPDGRADVFSLGIVLYEALAGHHPFLSDSYVATTHRIIHEKPTPIRIFNAKVPEGLQEIIARAMAKEPADRYANAHELLDDLRNFQSGITPSKLGWVLKQQRRQPRRLAIWLVALLFLAVIVAVALSQARLRQWLGWVAPAVAPRQLAVLPFTPSSDDDNSRAFARGLTETLALRLT